ncbi:MAG: alkanesulfonate monooxygenase SsuD [Natronomonas sp.]
MNPDFSTEDMLDIAEEAEDLCFDSAWVGDNLMEKPRHEPIGTLNAIAQRTETVELGTACMITTLRHPMQFAQAWTTLDVLSEWRTLLGACQGTPTEKSKHQHEMVGVPGDGRYKALEEGIEIMKQLWAEGSIDEYDGAIYDLEHVTFDTGNETIPFRPVRGGETPVLVTANPTHHGNQAVHKRIVSRIVDIGDGWQTANRWDQPEEYSDQINAIYDYADEQGVDRDELHTAYQITFNINEDREQAEAEMHRYIDNYYPRHDDPNFDSWGSVGSPQDVINQIEEYHERGCEHFVIRFGADDHYEQLRRFSEEVLPSFR